MSDLLCPYHLKFLDRNPCDFYQKYYFVGYRKKSSKRRSNRPKTTPPGGKVKIVTTDLTKSESRGEDEPVLSSEKVKSPGFNGKVVNKTGRYFNSSYGLTERDDGNFKGKITNGKPLSYHNSSNEVTVSTESNIFYRQRTNTGHKSKECGSRDSGSRQNRGNSYLRNKGNDSGEEGCFGVGPKLSPIFRQSTEKTDGTSLMKEGWSVTELPDDSLSTNGKWTNILNFEIIPYLVGSQNHESVVSLI